MESLFHEYGTCKQQIKKLKVPNNQYIRLIINLGKTMFSKQNSPLLLQDKIRL
jgi:hypothetical protein